MDIAIKYLTDRWLGDKARKQQLHHAMPAKITGLQCFTPRPQQNQRQAPNQSRPAPSNQQARTNKPNTQTAPANAGAKTDEEKKKAKKASNQRRKAHKKAK